MKKIIQNFLILFGIFSAYMVVMNICGYYYGYLSGDFLNQHFLLIEYFRNLFKETHDFFPQLSLNMGLMQGMTTLYYHGLYNPFFLLYYFISSGIKTIYIYEFIIILISASSGTGMYILAKKHDFNHRIATYLSFLSAFSGGMLSYYASQTMYSYYIPFFIFLLISVHYFLEKNQIWLFSIIFSIIFYTNFFFAPVVSVIVFLYLVILAKYKYQKKIKDYLPKFIIGYLIAVLLGMFVLVPYYELYSGGERAVHSLEWNNFLTFDLSSIYLLTSSIFGAGLGLISLIAIIYPFTHKTKDKKTLRIYQLIILLILVGYFYNGFDYSVNLFQYLKKKYTMFFSPLILLSFGYFLKNSEGNKKEQEKTILLASLLLLFMEILTIIFNNHVKTLPIAKLILTTPEYSFLFITINVIGIVCMLRKKKYFLVVLAIFNLNYFTIYAPIDAYKEMFILENDNGYEEINSDDNTLYRSYMKHSHTVSNISYAKNYFGPSRFSSLLNENYLQFVKKHEYMEETFGSRAISDASFNSYIYDKYLGFKYYLDENGKFHKQNFSVNPYIYGVSKENIYSQKSFENLSNTSKILSFNSASFVTNSNNSYIDEIPKTQVLKLDKYKYENKYPVVQYKDIELPTNIKDGELIIQFDVDNGKDFKKTEGMNIVRELSINDKINTVEGDIQNPHFVYIIDLNKNELNLKIPESTKWELSNIDVQFIKYKDIDKNSMPVIVPENFKINYNHGFEFSLNMPEDGYLETTIPYDEGFNVFIDNKEVPIEKINDTFLGAKISKGQHAIKINYIIPGFEIGTILSIIGIISLLALMSWELIKKKKPENK